MKTTVISVLVMLLAASVLADPACFKCHPTDLADTTTKAPPMDASQLPRSVHADLVCTDCHPVVSGKRHADLNVVTCFECHQEQMHSYNQSPHVVNLDNGFESLPTCATCHGAHLILAIDDPQSLTNHVNSVRLCISCHEDTQIQSEHATKMPEPAMIRAYENSIHGRALMIKGNVNAPACVDCHGSHSFLPSDDPESPLTKPHIAETCGQCHHKISQSYSESVHGTALVAGVLESPTCTSCHGEHDILAHEDPQSRVYPTVVSQTCSSCHAEETFIAKFGLKADRIETFKESFHGVANEFGDTRAANCASCHGTHDIYPQSDTRSTIHPDNIQATCGNCHEGLPAGFARGTVHSSAGSADSGGSYLVRKFYYWFIPMIIMLFALYRLLEYKRRVRRVG